MGFIYINTRCFFLGGKYGRHYQIWCIALTLFLLSLVRIFYKGKKYNDNIIKQPKMYFNGGLFVIFGFLFLILLINSVPVIGDYEEILVANLFFVLMMFFGFLFIIYYINWKIELKEKSFIYQNLFGRKKEYKYKECTTVTKSARIDIYFNDKVIIKVSLLIENWRELSDKLEPNLKKYKNSKI